MEIASVILFFIEWILVPIILLWFVLHGFMFEQDKSLNEESIRAAKAGGRAGLLIFVLFVISQKSKPWSISFSNPEAEFSIVFTIIGITLGFCLQHFIKTWRNVFIAVGSFALIHVACGSIALFSYVFLLGSNGKNEIAFLSLGTALGGYLNVMLFQDNDIASSKYNDKTSSKSVRDYNISSINRSDEKRSSS